MENFETRFITPGNAGSIAIYNGLAYVADGRNGLQVVNYKAFDINGISPTLQVSLDQSEEAIESSTLSIRAFVQDDIQVRNVEFHIDGSRAFTDGGYPFSHEHQVPLYQNQSSIRIRVLARDTGGNVAYWPGPSPDSELVLPIAEDLTPPEIVTYFPRENHSVFAGETLAIVFNERMDPESINTRSVRFEQINSANGSSPSPSHSNRFSTMTPPARPMPFCHLISIMPVTGFTPMIWPRILRKPLKQPTFDRHLYGPSEIRGKFWFDRNHNGIHESDEESLNQWTAYIDYNNNGSQDEGEPGALSGKDGEYLFSNLRSGVYTISESIPHGWTQTFPMNRNTDAASAFTNAGFLFESDLIAPPGEDPEIPHLSSFTVDSHGFAWEAGVVPGELLVGSHSFDGNGTAGLLYLARIMPTGNLEHFRTFGTPHSSNKQNNKPVLSADHHGGVWLAATFSDSNLSIGGEQITPTDVISSFLVRFDHEFNATCLHTFTGSTITHLEPEKNGHLRIGGFFAGQVDFGPFTLSSRGSNDGLLARLASTWEVSWAKSLGGSLTESISTISLDSNGRSWVSGSSASGDFLAGEHSLDSSSSDFLLCADENGSFLWANTVGSASSAKHHQSCGRDLGR